MKIWTYGILAALIAAGGCFASASEVQSEASAPSAVAIAAAKARIIDIEKRSGGRLGVALVDPAGRFILSQRGDERFAMCSTFKTLLAARILSDPNGLQLDDRLTINPAAVEGHAPFTRSRLDEGWMTVGEAAEHIVTVSDNAAANLLLDQVGGPSGLTQWIRTLGDDVTRLDRRELELNENAAGDPRDTTAPLAFAETYRKVMHDDAILGAAQRDHLAGWLNASVTGLDRLRAGVPEGWRVGDKTWYCAEPGAVEINDIAVFDPDGSGWYTLAFMLDRPRETGAFVDELAAEVGAIAAELVRPEA
ncbi:class A beta-lactamase [Aurantiacibacter suaedae]|uniref:class A beta-lactamase n=1 Tax=Aurantiacibacter suaedae TaxID=2545755 RepID=UPI0010F59A66|nr:class A beta-lactamase [Aurantiacibacter suaedae]